LEISPDGQEMFWNTVDMKTFSTQILSVKNVRGTWPVPHRVSPIPARFPSLSPDGRYLFFCGDDGNIYWADRKILDPFIESR
jgi:hypothetical protein